MYPQIQSISFRCYFLVMNTVSTDVRNHNPIMRRRLPKLVNKLKYRRRLIRNPRSRGTAFPATCPSPAPRKFDSGEEINGSSLREWSRMMLDAIECLRSGEFRR